MDVHGTALKLVWAPVLCQNAGPLQIRPASWRTLSAFWRFWLHLAVTLPCPVVCWQWQWNYERHLLLGCCMSPDFTSFNYI